MILDLSNIQFSRGDLKKGIKLPQTITSGLAELLGIHIGDGSMYKCGPSNDSYVIRYYGHKIDDKAYFTVYLPKLIKDVFNSPSSKLDEYRGNEARITICSKAISEFYNKIFHIKYGNKTRDADIPALIKGARAEIKCAFLRGLADTDFSISFKKKSVKGLHKYPVISGLFASKSIVKSAEDILKDIGIIPTVTYDIVSKRYEKAYLGHRIDINGRQNFDLWMKKIGFRNQKHLTKILVWEKLGYCPPETNILQRKLLLQETSMGRVSIELTTSGKLKSN